MDKDRENKEIIIRMPNFLSFFRKIQLSIKSLNYWNWNKCQLESFHKKIFKIILPFGLFFFSFYMTKESYINLKEEPKLLREIISTMFGSISGGFLGTCYCLLFPVTIPSSLALFYYSSK